MTSSFIGKVFDNYRILENLGIGGMGIVFKAIHIKLDKLLALKMIAPGLAMNDNFINRFQTEAKALAKLEDPNIVRIYDLRSDNDQWFIVMEYVNGSNLSDKLKHDGAYDWKEALPILKQILTAIGHAHTSGIIHRDMKPNNVMINREGQVKITDFGLAKDQSNIGSTLTMTSGGTLFYMSPEHVKGLSFTDKRSDIYSIGMTLYEMITGTVPFKNIDSDFDIRESIIRKDIDKPTKYNPDIPTGLEAIIMKSIAKNPDKRFQTAEEMLTAINEFEELSRISDDGSIVTEDQKSSKMRIRAKTTGTRHSRKGIYFGIIGSITTALLLFFILSADFLYNTQNGENTLKPAKLAITSSPVPATIYLNSDSVGSTPLKNYSIQPGKYLIHLKNKEFNVVDTTVHINESSDLALSFTLQPVPIKRMHAMASVKPVKKETIALVLTASVTINSQPAGADILMGGKLKGKTPLLIGELEPGSYHIEIRKDGYENYEHNIDLRSGKNSDISTTLSALSGGLLVVTTPASAKIILDGTEISNPNRPLRMKGIPVGRHQIEIAHEGYSSVIKNIDILQNEVQKIEADLEQLIGELSVQVRPWGAIYINDNLQKPSTDRKFTVKLPVTQYQVKVMHPTLGRWEKMIQLKAENKTEILVDFNRKKPIIIGAVDENGNPVYGEIYIDNQNTGKSTPEEVVVHQGLHKLIVKKDGYIAQNGEKEVLVDENFSERLTFILKKVK